MLNLEIYTVGGIDFLMPVFRALVIFLGGSAIASFVKLFTISGLLFAIWISIFGRDKLFFVKHFLMAVFLVNLSFAPIANLTIIDTKYNRIETISNFPFLPGLFLSIGSVSADFFTNAIDSLFHTGTTVVWSGGSGSYLADLDYRNTGFLGSMDLMRRTLSFRLRKVPEFNTLQNMVYTYIEQCFFPYITTLGDAQLRDILTSRDLFSVMRVNGYLIEYNGSVYTCGEFYDNELTPRWNNLKLKLQNNPEVAGFVFEESLRVPSVVQALARASYSFQDAVAQAGLINAVSYVLSAQNVDDYTLLSAYISGRAQEQSKLLWRGLGAFMADTLPRVRNYIIAVAVFFSFMLIPMMLLPFFGQTPGSVLVGFAKFIAWAWFWDPMLALLDAGTKIMAIQKTTAWLANQNLDGISIATLAELVNDAEWYPAVAGYIAIFMVPTLSWLFFRGFDAGIAGIAYMFSGLAGGVREEFSRMTQNIQRDYLGSLTGELNSGTWAWRETYSGNIDSLTDIYRKEELAGIYGSSLGYAQTRAHAEAVLDQEKIGRGLGIEHGANRLGLTPQQVGFAGGFTSSVSTVAPYRVLGEDTIVAKSYTDARRILGAYQAWQGFVNEYFNGDSTAAARWMEAYSLLRTRGDLEAFENYVQEQGLDKYIGTRYGELLNETAKIYREFEAAGLMGRDPYTHFSAKHSDIHTTLQSRQDVLNFADRLEESGFADLAKEIKANPDKWVGATLSFVLTSGGGIGAFSLRKEGEVISGSREETYDINRDIKLDERRDEVIDVTGTKKEVYTENITRQETGDITRYYGGNIFVGNAIEAAIGQKSVDPLLNRPHILNLLRDEASKEDLQLVASEVTTVIEEHGSLTQVIEKAQRGELGGKFGTILSKYIKMGIEAGGQSYITSGVEAQRNLVRQAVYNALEELIGNQDYSARDRWGFLISWSGNFIDSFNERNYGDMNPEAVHFTNPTFVKEQASFGGAPEYYVKALGLSGLVSPYYLAAMYSKDGTVMTGELVRWATEAMSMGLQGKEALEYLRRHAFDPNPSEEDIEAIRNKTIYKVETGSDYDKDSKFEREMRR